MCVNDWRFGTLIRASGTAFSLGVGQSLAIPANAQRVGWSVGLQDASAANTANVTVLGAVLFAMGGISPIVYHVTLATHGDLPTRAFIIARLGGTATGGVIEYFAPQEYLTAALDEFRRLYPKLFPPG